MTEVEQGSGTLLVAAVCACLLTGAVAGLGVVEAVQRSHRARAAADLVALAGAAALVEAGPDEACERGARVAADNGAMLVTCRSESGSLHVVVEVAGPGRLPPAVARSRAGPAEDTTGDLPDGPGRH